MNCIDMVWFENLKETFIKQTWTRGHWSTYCKTLSVRLRADQFSLNDDFSPQKFCPQIIASKCSVKLKEKVLYPAEVGTPRSENIFSPNKYNPNQNFKFPFPSPKGTLRQLFSVPLKAITRWCHYMVSQDGVKRWCHNTVSQDGVTT